MHDLDRVQWFTHCTGTVVWSAVLSECISSSARAGILRVCQRFYEMENQQVILLAQRRQESQPVALLSQLSKIPSCSRVARRWLVPAHWQQSHVCRAAGHRRGWEISASQLSRGCCAGSSALFFRFDPVGAWQWHFPTIRPGSHLCVTGWRIRMCCPRESSARSMTSQASRRSLAVACRWSRRARISHFLSLACYVATGKFDATLLPNTSSAGDGRCLSNGVALNTSQVIRTSDRGPTFFSMFYGLNVSFHEAVWIRVMWAWCHVIEAALVSKPPECIGAEVVFIVADHTLWYSLLGKRETSSSQWRLYSSLGSGPRKRTETWNSNQTR